MELPHNPGSAGWLRERYNSVTGTDIGKIMGMDQTCSRKRLLMSKVRETDLLENASPITKTLVGLGNTFEEAAREAFIKGDRAKRIVGFRPGMYQSVKCHFLTGTPDYLMPREKTVVEIKTHFYPSIQEAVPLSDVPLKHYLQVQCYLEILDYETGLLYSWTVTRGHTLFSIQRDRTLWDTLIQPAIQQFHDCSVSLKDMLKEGGEEEVDRILRRSRMKSGEKIHNYHVISQSHFQHVTKIE